MSEPLRALIVDDEPAARRRLALLCAQVASLEVVGEAAGGEEALAALEHTAVDLLFLDIEMPGLSGMALAERLCVRADAPAIVFVTAFDRFAVAAFGVNAAGYLLKPVDPNALARCVSHIGSKAKAPAPSPYLEAIWAPHRGELVRIDVQAIDWFASEGDYVRLHVSNRSFLLSERLYAVESRLDPARFIRVHRSSIVQAQRVVSLAHAGAGAWELTLTTGHVLPIGRSHLDSVRAALQTARPRG